MLVRKISLKTTGYLKIQVEGFFIQRFINLCISKGVFIYETDYNNNNNIIITNISKNDFRKVCIIAKKSKCKIKILKKGGIPFLVHKYRKRKLFYFLFTVLFIICFTITRFIWNIDIIGCNNIDEKQIMELLEKNGIKSGVLISKVNIDSIINIIRLERTDISWVGAKIKGTNFIIEIKEAELKPEIVDESKYNNIISNKSGIISRINVQSGTARVSVGDKVEKGTLLVEGVMEGKYTGIRYVNSRADIYANVVYTKTKKGNLNKEEKIETGNEYNQYKINFNKFAINLNKGVSNFENYDTIETKKKLRIFSNYYLPIEFEKIVYKEYKKVNKKYTTEEFTNELKTKLENEIMDCINNKYENYVDSSFEVNTNGNEITVTVNCIVEEKIGIYEDLVF